MHLLLNADEQKVVALKILAAKVGSHESFLQPNTYDTTCSVIFKESVTLF